MSCLGCGDRDQEACGCLSACLGRRKGPQRPRALPTELAQQDRGRIGTIQTTHPVTSHTEPGRHTVPREPSGRQDVSSMTSTAGTRDQASPRDSAGQRAAHPDAPTCGEGVPRAPQVDPAGQRPVGSWPRTTAIRYNAQSGFATQQASPGGPQPAPSAGRGQTLTPSGEIQRSSAGPRSAQLRPAGQQVANTPVPGIEPVRGRPPGLSLTRRQMGQYSIEIAVEAAITVGPKVGQPRMATLEKFVIDLARHHNREVASPHPRISERFFEQDDGPCREWFITAMSPHLTTTTSPSSEPVPIQ